MIHVPGFRITSLDQLEQIKAGCDSTIDNYATTSGAASAASGLIPGGNLIAAAAGTVVDIAVVYDMLSALRSRYSLDTVNAADIKVYGVQVEIVNALVTKVFGCVTKTGVKKFLSQFATKSLVKKIGGAVPIIGGVISGYTGYQITKIAGETYSRDCYDLCREILNA